LKEAAVLRNGPDVLDALCRRRGEAQEIPSPYAGVLLLPDYGKGRFGLGDCLKSRLECGGINRTGWCQLGQGAVPDGFPGIGKQPGDGNPVLGGQFQMGSLSAVGATNARKISSDLTLRYFGPLAAVRWHQKVAHGV